MLRPMILLYQNGFGTSHLEVTPKRKPCFSVFDLKADAIFGIFAGEKFPPALTVPLSRISTLRYGENPHQKASVYADDSLSVVNAGGIATAIQHHGKVRGNLQVEIIG